MEFKEARNIVDRRTKEIIQKPALFQTLNKRDRKILTGLYIDSFPEGANPTFRENSEHFCMTCFNFIGRFGGVVAIDPDTLERKTVWDVEGAEQYQPSFDAMAEYIRNKPIIERLYVPEGKHKFGIVQNRDRIRRDLIWHHFHVTLPERFHRAGLKTPEATRLMTFGEVRHDYMIRREGIQRQIEEFPPGVIAEFHDMAKAGDIYFPSHNYTADLKQLMVIQREALDIEDDAKREDYYWVLSSTLSPLLCKLHQSSLGSAMAKRSKGDDMEEVMAFYRYVTASERYQRATKAATEDEATKAMAAFEQLGYMDSIQRRFAVSSDIHIRNNIHTDSEVRAQVQGTKDETRAAFNKIIAVAPDRKPPKLDTVRDVSWEEFERDILPGCTGVEIYLQNRHIPNLMTLLAPINMSAPPITAWDNGFNTVYYGNLSDSGTDAYVQKFGGSIIGDVRAKIKWNELNFRGSGNKINDDDLDHHCQLPSGRKIFYEVKDQIVDGGKLDVDIIQPSTQIQGPDKTSVENIIFADVKTMQNGKYMFGVHMFTNRRGKGGWRAELNVFDTVYHWDYNASHRGMVWYAEAELKSGKISVKPLLEVAAAPEEKPTEIWGISTMKFHPVSMIMPSPGHWHRLDKKIGNRHILFMIKGCERPESPRSILTQDLKPELKPHSRTIERLGDELRPEYSIEQLSGVGFSTGRPNSVIFRTHGPVVRDVRVNFN